MMLFLTCSRKVNSFVVLNTVNLIFCPKSDVGRPKLRDTSWIETCHFDGVRNLTYWLLAISC